MQEIDNLFESVVKPLVLEQYKYAVRWNACLKAVIDKLQAVENGAFALQEYFRIPPAYSVDAITADRLEYLASVKNVFRQPGETDQDLFNRFLRSCNIRDEGTPENVIRNASLLSGDPSPSYLEEAPATFFEYTPDGRQLEKEEVGKLAPAGVLGLVGAAIDVGGTLLVDAEGRLILMVADANPYESGVRLATESRDGILTETGDFIVTE